MGENVQVIGVENLIPYRLIYQTCSFSLNELTQIAYNRMNYTVRLAETAVTRTRLTVLYSWKNRST
jgi:hypothetical protein